MIIDKPYIMNNITKKDTDSIAKNMEHKYEIKAKVLNSKEYKYIQSLRGERKSGIICNRWPNNYIDAAVLETIKRECEVIFINTMDTEILNAIRNQTGITPKLYTDLY